MTSRRPAAATATSRVSQNAPESASPSAQAWADALSDEPTVKALQEGLADVAAGRLRPWAEIRTSAARS